MEQNDIVKREETSPMEYANQFLSNGGDLANLEKMMDLQERYEDNQARKAFHVAMAEFKKNPPKLSKSKKVDYTTKSGSRTQYNHAELGNITETINSALAEQGLTAAWKTEQEGGVKVTCTITHVLGYSESTFQCFALHHKISSSTLLF